MLTQSQLALDMSSSARHTQRPLPGALTQPGEGNAGEEALHPPPFYCLVQLFTALMIKGGGGRPRDWQVEGEAMGPPMKMHP